MVYNMPLENIHSIHVTDESIVFTLLSKTIFKVTPLDLKKDLDRVKGILKENDRLDLLI